MKSRKLRRILNHALCPLSMHKCKPRLLSTFRNDLARNFLKNYKILYYWVTCSPKRTCGARIRNSSRLQVILSSSAGMFWGFPTIVSSARWRTSAVTLASPQKACSWHLQESYIMMARGKALSKLRTLPRTPGL